MTAELERKQKLLRTQVLVLKKMGHSTKEAAWLLGIDEREIIALWEPPLPPSAPPVQSAKHEDKDLLPLLFNQLNLGFEDLTQGQQEQVLSFLNCHKNGLKVARKYVENIANFRLKKVRTKK